MTIDFTKYSDDVLLASYQRINEAKFPAQLEAARAELLRRGLTPPERPPANSPQDGDLLVPFDLLGAASDLLLLIGR